MPEPAQRLLSHPRLVAEEGEKLAPMDRRVESKPRARRWLLIGGSVAVLVACCAALYARYALTRSVTVRAASVVIAPVRREVFTEYVAANAIVAPRKTAYLDAVEGGNAVGVGVDAITFGLERKGHRGQDIAVIIDESDGWHGGLLT